MKRNVEFVFEIGCPNNPLKRHNMRIYRSVTRFSTGTLFFCGGHHREKGQKVLSGHPKDRGKNYSNSKTNSLQPVEDDASQFTSKTGRVKQSYLVIPISNEGKLGVIGKQIQRATILYLTKIL